MPCAVCEKSEANKPMCFRGLPYCSDLHRKILAREITEIVDEPS